MMTAKTKSPAASKPSLLGSALKELTLAQRQTAIKKAAALLQMRDEAKKSASPTIRFNERRGYVPGGPIPAPTGTRKAGEPDPT